MTSNSYSSPGDTPEGDAVGAGDETLQTVDDNVRDLADIPAIEVITRSVVMLMSAAAEKLGHALGTYRPPSGARPASRISEKEAGAMPPRVLM